MPQPLRAPTKDRDDGFTLIELMVVVLVFATLMGIAIPTFVGARPRAQNRVAQTYLRNALTAEKVYYVDAQRYTAEASELSAIEPTLTYSTVGWSASDPRQVYVQTADVTSLSPRVAAAIVCLANQSASGTVFAIKDVAAGPNIGRYYASGTGWTCADTGTDGFWKEKW